MRYRTIFVAASFASLAPFSLASSDYACRIDPSGNTSGQSADICDQVVRRWRLLAGGPPAPGEIRLIARGAPNSVNGAGHWTLEWPAPAPGTPSTQRRKRDGLSAHLAENILPHEAGHHVIATSLGIQPRASDAYGSAAPDWLDEAAAVWMESRTAREQRMRTVASTQPSLTKIALMDHPARTQIQHDLLDANVRNVERTVMAPCPHCSAVPETVRSKYRIVTTTITADGARKVAVSYSDTDPSKDATVEQRGFYPFAYSLLRFIRSRGGVTAVLELMGRYRANPAPRVEVLLGLPGLPNSVAAFEAEWRAFLRNPPPEDP